MTTTTMMMMMIQNATNLKEKSQKGTQQTKNHCWFKKSTWEKQPVTRQQMMTKHDDNGSQVDKEEVEEEEKLEILHFSSLHSHIPQIPQNYSEKQNCTDLSLGCSSGELGGGVCLAASSS
jgi:hypothetical protein